MSDDDHSGGPIDVATLEVLARRADTHPLVDHWAFQPDAISPRRLELDLDAGQYPPSVDAVRLDVRWFEDGNYTLHYIETHEDGSWQCRWDRHPKPDGPREHFHPPPDADFAIEPSPLQTSHHLGVLFEVLDWIDERIERPHDE